MSMDSAVRSNCLRLLGFYFMSKVLRQRRNLRTFAIKLPWREGRCTEIESLAAPLQPVSRAMCNYTGANGSSEMPGKPATSMRSPRYGGGRSMLNSAILLSSTPR